MLLKHRNINNIAFMAEWLTMRMEDLDEEAVGRDMCAVRLEFLYGVPGFGEDRDIPPWPPAEPPYAPQPDWPEVATTDVQIDNVLPTEEVS
jgi:hypothetical protein